MAKIIRALDIVSCFLCLGQKIILIAGLCRQVRIGPAFGRQHIREQDIRVSGRSRVTPIAREVLKQSLAKSWAIIRRAKVRGNQIDLCLFR